MHMIKGSPFASAPDELKLKFVEQPGGQFVSDFMQLEQRLLGDWKVEKIVEAAGPAFDPQAARQELLEVVAERPIVMFSFVDCPWCLAAKQLLQDLGLDEAELRVLELEDLAGRGKRLRAALALATGRTSLPAVFVGGRAVGGFTDGFGSFDEVRAASRTLSIRLGYVALLRIPSRGVWRTRVFLRDILHARSAHTAHRTRSWARRTCASRARLGSASYKTEASSRGCSAAEDPVDSIMPGDCPSSVSRGGAPVHREMHSSRGTAMGTAR